LITLLEPLYFEQSDQNHGQNNLRSGIREKMFLSMISLDDGKLLSAIEGAGIFKINNDFRSYAEVKDWLFGEIR
jgi:hypothetical protein